MRASWSLFGILYLTACGGSSDATGDGAPAETGGNTAAAGAAGVGAGAGGGGAGHGGAGNGSTGNTGGGGGAAGSTGGGGGAAGSAAGGGSAAGASGAAGSAAGASGAAGAPGTPASEVEMTFTTANIGRDYGTKADVAAVFDKIGDVLDGKSGPRFVGWQEIGEGDPCGSSCEIDALEARFKAGWTTRRPKGEKPGGGSEVVKVPVTSRDAEGAGAQVRAVYASAGWAEVSPTRFVTVVYYPERMLSIVNTHFIAKAWSCGSEEAKRREYWKKGWAVLQAEVAKEHQAGRNVIATGDLNRKRAADNCNPAWQPSSLHADAKVIGGTGIDYIFAVPASGRQFVGSKKADGTTKGGTIPLGIDGHEAHWISGRFLPK